MLVLSYTRKTCSPQEKTLYSKFTYGHIHISKKTQYPWPLYDKTIIIYSKFTRMYRCFFEFIYVHVYTYFLIPYSCKCIELYLRVWFCSYSVWNNLLIYQTLLSTLTLSGIVFTVVSLFLGPFMSRACKDQRCFVPCSRHRRSEDQIAMFFSRYVIAMNSYLMPTQHMLGLSVLEATISIKPKTMIICFIFVTAPNGQRRFFLDFSDTSGPHLRIFLALQRIFLSKTIKPRKEMPLIRVFE